MNLYKTVGGAPRSLQFSAAGKLLPSQRPVQRIIQNRSHIQTQLSRMKFLAKFFQTDGGHIKERIYDPY